MLVSSILRAAGETGVLPGVAQSPAQLPLLVAQPVVSDEGDHWRSWYLHPHTAVVVGQPGATVELGEPDLLVVVRLVLHELPPGYEEIVLREILLALLLLLLVAVSSTANEFLQINS